MTQEPEDDGRYASMKLRKIISGGQTGADQGGLDAAKYLSLETGGWIPKGRRTDDGPMSDWLFEYYGLQEHASASYPSRTRQNVLDADATVLFGNTGSPGCTLTMRECMANKKPFIVNPSPRELGAFLTRHDVEVLNVAGNRERTNRGIHDRTLVTLVVAVEQYLRKSSFFDE